MNRPQRDKIKKAIKQSDQNYLATLKTSECYLKLERKFKNLERKFGQLLRKQYESERSLHGVSQVGRLVSGLMEFIKQNDAPYYDFAEYKRILNDYLTKYIEERRTSKYNGQCSSYGETLFVLYLDLFISATMYKPERELQAHPPFLINPKTGALLEVDALIEDFRLAFEFQGEHHYTDLKTQERDHFKLEECRKKRIVLIPVNISQLNSVVLQELIVNSIKDFLGLHDIFTASRDTFKLPSSVSWRQVTSFCKIVERLYTSTVVFDTCAAWLDGEAGTYISKSAVKNPLSSTMPAPRQLAPRGDFDIGSLYRCLKHISQIRKGRLP